MPPLDPKGYLSTGVLSWSSSTLFECKPFIQKKINIRLCSPTTLATKAGNLQCHTKGKVDVQTNDYDKKILIVGKEKRKYTHVCLLKTKNVDSESLLNFIRQLE